jgi:ribonuclease G
VGDNNLEETVLKTNIEATKEIAKQLRLRDIGGIVIIDFIDMNDAEHQQMVLESLRISLKGDRTKTIVLGMTGLGLVEMTRKKIRQELSTVMNCDCPCCDGTGKVYTTDTHAMNILKEIREYLKTTAAKSIKVEVHTSVAAIVENHAEMLAKEYENNSGVSIAVYPVSDLKAGGLRIKEIDKDSLLC